MKRRMKRHPVVQPLDPSYRLIALTQGQNAIVDAEDFEWLNQRNWHAGWDKGSNKFYARTAGNVFMHQVILNCYPPKEVDHKNHNTLDNRKQNLRKASHSQNQSNAGIRHNNTSGFKGVNWHKRYRKWDARISHKGRSIFIGSFISAKQAARAYDQKAKELNGEFAHLNFPSRT